MSVGTIWVHTEVAEGSVASITLEMLAKAREISSDVVAIVGGDGNAVAAELGAHGATSVLATGDLGSALPGPSVAGAMAAAIAGGAAPAAILIGTTYGGRDVAGRLSVKLDASVITNIVDLDRRRRSCRNRARLRWGFTRQDQVHDRQARDLPGSSEVIRSRRDRRRHGCCFGS